MEPQVEFPDPPLGGDMDFSSKEIGSHGPHHININNSKVKSKGWWNLKLFMFCGIILVPSLYKDFELLYFQIFTSRLYFYNSGKKR